MRNEKEYRGGMGFMMAKAGHQKNNITMTSTRGSGSITEYLSCGTYFNNDYQTQNSRNSKVMRPLSKERMESTMNNPD